MLPKVSIEDAVRLCSSIIDEEIKLSMFSVGEDKSPGPDGYTSSFFKSSWKIMGDDVISAVHYYFQTCNLFAGFNSTSVSLFPKCPNPCKVNDFRSISCCSVVYKCITKVIVNRLQIKSF